MDYLSKSPRINKALKKMQIYSFYDVIYHVPRKYEDMTLTRNDRFLLDKQKVVIYGEIVTLLKENSYRKIKVICFDLKSKNSNTLHHIVAFNRNYLVKAFKTGDSVTISGIYNKKDNSIILNSVNKGDDSLGKIKPIYSLPSDLANYEYMRLVNTAFKNLEGKIFSPLPFSYINKYKLGNKERALKLIHQPSSLEEIKKGYRFVKYEEALLFSLKNQLIRENNKSFTKAKKEPIGIESVEPFVSSLPFKLTKDQFNVTKEIIDDMNQNYLMYRLLQGDVGSGKTIVSFIALFANYLRGDQGALMAPTDALARQHYENAKTLFEPFKIKIALLLGSTPTSEKKKIKSDLQDGYIDIIIGTHALFSKDVNYSSLGLAVIDEQHRFGVNQRASLVDKGKHIDLLMMSATPIPRSLALTIFGDLDVSTISSFPTKEKNIKTIVVEESSDLIFEKIEESLSNKRQIYVVAPLIEEKEHRNSVEELFMEYKRRFKEKVGLLHGKMKQIEKEEILKRFYNNEVPILVTTQVIEVGIDVKTSNLMIIYDAENFGLASLHQLRGRIGRDGYQSTCILVSSENDERLSILENTLDGFLISEQDMKNRGPGELSGLRQSGLPEFNFLNVITDLKIFVSARDDAKEIILNKEEKSNKYIIEKAKREIDKGFITNA